MKKGNEIFLEIKDLSSEGLGIGRIDNFVIFVESTVPGDFVNARIIKKKSSYAKAELVSIAKASIYREIPPCEYFNICGGCKLQNYKYEKQLEYKTNNVLSAFSKIGGFDFENVQIKKITGCDNIYNYRNKTELTFSDDKWYPEKQEIKQKEFVLGYHVPNFYTKLIDIEKCLLQSEIADEIYNFSRTFFKNKNITIYNSYDDCGFLRFLMIRKSFYTTDLMINIVTFDFDDDLIYEYKNNLIQKFPEITTIINSITKKKSSVSFGEKSKVIYGSGTIIEKLYNGNFQYLYKISPNSFFQTNTKQAEKLYLIGQDFLELNFSDRLLDLYCGTGSITLFYSGKVSSATGVELIEDSIIDANENAKINNVTNCEFIISDIKDYIKTKTNLSEFNKLVLDPPRSGLHPEICQILSESGFEKILYISCNPSTQARDIATICSKGKYIIKSIHPVDMFPHTYHIENVCLLENIKNIF